MDGTVHGVTKIRRRLNDFHFQYLKPPYTRKIVKMVHPLFCVFHCDKIVCIVVSPSVVTDVPEAGSR